MSAPTVLVTSEFPYLLISFLWKNLMMDFNLDSFCISYFLAILFHLKLERLHFNPSWQKFTKSCTKSVFHFFFPLVVFIRNYLCNIAQHFTPTEIFLIFNFIPFYECNIVLQLKQKTLAFLNVELLFMVHGCTISNWQN